MDRDLLARVMGSRWASPIGPFLGMFAGPNIDLEHRPLVQMPGGGTGTIYSGTYGVGDGQAVLLPKISPEGELLNRQQTLDRFHRTKQMLGMFATPEDADRYAQALHEAQARYYGLGGR